MIRAENIDFHIGEFHLRRFTIEIVSGTYFVMLGPPGSGKTIFLECLTGLKTVDSGTITLDGRDVTRLEPRSRAIGYVPQDYALFPHLSVGRNIEFALRVSGLNRRTIDERVRAMADMLDITHLLDRRIAGLSGGEKQRTALARALVMQPRLLLLDEPVCALDEGTRQRICSLLRRIQQQLSLTVIHVSHNLEEAFSVADAAAIVHKGSLQQTGPLGELLRQPRNEFVARFMRCENIFDAELTPESDTVSTAEFAGIRLSVPGPRTGPAKLMIRPENISVTPPETISTRQPNTIPVKLAVSRDYGGYMRLELQGPVNLVAHISRAEFAALDARPDTPLSARLPRECIHLLTD